MVKNSDNFVNRKKWESTIVMVKKRSKTSTTIFSEKRRGGKEREKPP